MNPSVSPHPVSGVDHCFTLVSDLDRSIEQFRRLGFTLSPRGLHSEKMGSANTTAVFEAGDYFELLGIIAPTEQNKSKRDQLAKDGEGLRAIACRIGDARDARTKLAALGLSTTEVVDFERPVLLPDGRQTKAAFSITQFDAQHVPFGTAFMCQHHTRDAVWIPALLNHPNGAKGLGGIVAAVADPQSIATAYARLFSGGSPTPVDGGYEVATGTIPLTFVTPEILARNYRGIDVSKIPPSAFAVMQIATDNLKSIQENSLAEQLSLVETPRGLAAPPAIASGVIVEFLAK
jgi:hypothetical protein